MANQGTKRSRGRSRSQPRNQSKKQRARSRSNSRNAVFNSNQENEDDDNLQNLSIGSLRRKERIFSNAAIERLNQDHQEIFAVLMDLNGRIHSGNVQLNQDTQHRLDTLVQSHMAIGARVEAYIRNQQMVTAELMRRHLPPMQ